MTEKKDDKPKKFLSLSELLKNSEKRAEEERKKREQHNESLKWRLRLGGKKK